MPFPGGRFPFLPGAHCREITAGPCPPDTTTGASPARPEGCGACSAPQMRLRLLRRPPHPSRGLVLLVGQTWATAARLLAGEARGRGREKASGLAPGPCIPLAWDIGPRPSPSAPSRSSRQQSSRPPPPPPATPESWQWQWQKQRRKGEPRRLPPCEPQTADRAATTTTASAQEPTATGSFLAVALFPSEPFPRVTHGQNGRVRTGKGCGGLFLWGTWEPPPRHQFGCSCQPSSDFLVFGPPCCLLSTLHSAVCCSF